MAFILWKTSYFIKVFKICVYIIRKLSKYVKRKSYFNWYGHKINLFAINKNHTERKVNLTTSEPCLLNSSVSTRRRIIIILCYRAVAPLFYGYLPSFFSSFIEIRPNTRVALFQNRYIITTGLNPKPHLMHFLFGYSCRLFFLRTNIKWLKYSFKINIHHGLNYIKCTYKITRIRPNLLRFVKND